ncbi:uncharacterized protein SCHCODRAFT_02500339 [Schizophyllum commune H4-8]|uniref:Expressed protein n=1 Tax=Schizophyllum commune (strain H4-8 / FGSC 9210) TaxID=578458 RepID=D8PNE4_SCHCM|nr:uncharacterized protein SCHCODRAFT_02500339 [Schizophyllum commune H4-8]KAI5893172.1 hypothetical protein SCHCODRAFT_02500339 [Schizophyllum commune H4-8]
MIRRIDGKAGWLSIRACSLCTNLLNRTSQRRCEETFALVAQCKLFGSNSFVAFMSDSTRSRGRDAWPPFTGQRPKLSFAPHADGNVSPSGNASYAAGPKYQDANFTPRMQPSAMPPPPCFNGGYSSSLSPSSTPATPGPNGMSRPARGESLGSAHPPPAAIVSLPARASLAPNMIYATPTRAAPAGGPLEGTGRFVPPAADIRAGQEEAAARLARQQGFAARPPPPPELATRLPPSVWPLPGQVHQFHSWLFASQLSALDMYSAAKIDRKALARALLTVPVPASC